MSTSRLFTILLFSAAMYGQVPSMPGPASLGDEHPHASTPLHFIRSSDEFEPSIAPDALEWTLVQPARPVSGSVSLRELEHPIAKKALRAAYDAQVFSRKHNIGKAIEKLEQAVRIDPSYRDAHCNLGVQYARVGRFTDARTEFQKALDIGPPTALLYANLALALTNTGDSSQAAMYARKALELDPGSYGAQLTMQLVSH